MPTAAMTATTAAGIHQTHVTTIAGTSKAAARLVSTATEIKRINAARLPRKSVRGERSGSNKPRTTSVLNAEAADQRDCVPVRVGERRQAHALVGVDDLTGLKTTLFQVVDVGIEVLHGEVDRRRAGTLLVGEHLNPSTRNDLPFDHRGHRVVVA